jgi:hypothetical protein
MSDEKPMESKNPSAEDMTKKPTDTQLNEEDLKKATGGAVNAYLIIDDRPGPSTSKP